MEQNKSELRVFAKKCYIRIKDIIKEQLSKLNIKELNFSLERINDLSIKFGFTSYSELDSSLNYFGFIKKLANTWFSRLIILKALKVNNIDYSLEELGEYKNKLTLFLSKLSYISDNLFNPKDISNLVFPIENELIKEVLSLPDNLFISDCFLETFNILYENFSSDYKVQTYKKLKKRYKIEASTLPVVTQLFTPSYIVKYLVQNALGRLWINHLITQNPDLNEDVLIDQYKLEYYIPTHFELKNYSKKTIHYFRNLKLENLTILDPAMGTGSILSYSFDLLLEFYKNEGYKEDVAVVKILENNLFGFEIDNEVFRINEIGLKLKAYKYNKNIFNQKLNLHFYCFENLKLDYSLSQNLFDNTFVLKDKIVQKQLKLLLEEFTNSRLLGSLLKPGNYNFSIIKKSFYDYELTNFNKENLIEIPDQIIQLIEIAELLRKQYNIVVTNPPYFSNRNFNPILKKYLKDYYKNNSKDLYTAFIDQCLNLTKSYSYCALVTMNSWLFLKYNENLRKSVLNNTIINMVHLGTNAFEEINGEVVQTVAFVIQKEKLNKFKGSYLRLLEVDDKEKGIKNKINLTQMNSDNYRFIPGIPIAYWTNEEIINHFKEDIKLEEIADSKQGLATTENKRFLRQWTEVDFNKINFNAYSTKDAKDSNYKWFPYNKGGSFRKWFGNDQYIVNYYRDGIEIKESVLKKYPYLKTPDYVVKNTDYYFKPSITWSLINTGIPSFRYKESGYIFDVAGMSVFTENYQFYLLGLLNSVVTQKFLEIIAPTINYQCGDIAQIPIIIDDKKIDEIELLVRKNIEISKNDWNENELSWNFKRIPLINLGKSLKESIDNLKLKQEKRFNLLKENEEKLNKQFLKIYSLENKYSYKIKDKDVSIKRSTNKEIIKDFLSFFIGVLFGRYSLDKNGLILSNTKFRNENYKTFKPVINNFVPIQSFGTGKDIIDYLKIFINTIFPSDNLEDDFNLIAKVINEKSKKESSEVIRDYFKNQFIKDHQKKYNNRPIYLQTNFRVKGVSDGLIYYHRIDGTQFNSVIKALKENIRILKEELIKLKPKKRVKTKESKIKKLLEKNNQLLNTLENLSKEEIDLDEGIISNLKKIQTLTNGKVIKIFK